MPRPPKPDAPWRPANQHGHVIARVKFGPHRSLTCSCGHYIRREPSDEEQGHAFALHRREAPPEPRDVLRARKQAGLDRSRVILARSF